MSTTAQQPVAAPEQTETFAEVTIKLRKATAKDFSYDGFRIMADGKLCLDENRNPISEKKPKLGQPFWVKSMFTGEFDNRNYQISESTDWKELKEWLKRDMVYVPASIFELKDAGQ